MAPASASSNSSLAGQPPPTPPNAGTPLEGAAEISAADSGDDFRPSDRDLVGRAKTGDDTAFEALMQRYKALVSLVAFRQSGDQDQVEDIAQEAFVKAFLHLQELDDAGRFKAWLLRITANVAMDHLRRRKRDGVSLDQTGAMAAAESAGASAHGKSDLQEAGARVVDGELRAQIVEAIYALPEEYQGPAAMRYLEEVPYREISKRLGLREETLRKRIHRANQMLRRKLRKLWPEGEEL